MKRRGNALLFLNYLFMDGQKITLAVVETVAVTAPPYLLYIEHITPVFTFLSAVIGTVYISIKAFNEVRKK